MSANKYTRVVALSLELKAFIMDDKWKIAINLDYNILIWCLPFKFKLHLVFISIDLKNSIVNHSVETDKPYAI